MAGLALVWVAPSHSQTADGQTPAEETICDALSTRRLNHELGGQKSVGLGTLERLGAKEICFGALSKAVEELLGRSK